MDTYIVNVYCDRTGFEVEEVVQIPEDYPHKAHNTTDTIVLTLAETQHSGHCGTKHDPCLSEANSFEVGAKICPDCDRVLPEEYTRCWACENKHGREVG
jgi:hypothetical protein